ncbi:MAG: hypothetical protein M0Z61_05805 [Nitrospiraceae bacterium]|nr:hypothetical protein [Nitrospiraceae bacterium]
MALYLCVLFLFPLALLMPAPDAWGIIEQGYAGLYPHQMAHAFFLISLVIFICYIRQKELTKERGWLYISISAALLVLWNAFAFIGHEELLNLDRSLFINTGDFLKSAVKAGPAGLHYMIYKMDNLILVVSFFFLYLGIRRQYKTYGGRQ